MNETSEEVEKKDKLLLELEQGIEKIYKENQVLSEQLQERKQEKEILFQENQDLKRRLEKSLS